MNDPHYFLDLDQRFPELDDDAFWAQIASQVDTTALLHPDEPVVQEPYYLTTPYRPPTTEHLLLPAPRTRAIAPAHERAREASTPTVQAPEAIRQQARAKKQSMLLPMILMGLAAIVILAIFNTAVTGNRFNDTTPQVQGTWDVHCDQGPPGAGGGANSIVGPATIDADFVNKVLHQYGSPMDGQGKLFVEISQYCGLDPAYVLAFYMHESSFGLSGEARFSLSPGNLRCIPGVRCQDGYAWFDSWQDGLMVQCRLLRNLYVDGWHLATPEEIIPRYAPAADNNNEAAYEYALEHAVSTWRQHIVVVS